MDVIVEIRAGVGGTEASLFAEDLYTAYFRYAEAQNWEVDVIEAKAVKNSGFSKIIFGIKGTDVFNVMKFESGVHRVQRIPKSETRGRVHTSTATVAVLPEPKDIDIQIDMNDVRIDTFNSGGHGGQHAQKNMTAVRYTHIPTNTVATCQDERSLEKNKQRAMMVLKTRLHQAEQEKQTSAANKNRHLQIGGANRSEKIRTYNYPQDRVTDHRNKKKFSAVTKIMNGELTKMFDSLLEWEKK